MTALTIEEFRTAFTRMKSARLKDELFNLDEEMIYVNKSYPSDWHRTGPEDENEGREDTNSRDEDGEYGDECRDEPINVDRPFEGFQCNNIDRQASFRSIKNRENQGTVHNSESDNGRITALYELGKGRALLNNEAATKLKTDNDIVNIESMKASKRIIDLYEFGRDRVIFNRESDTTKFKANRVIVNTESNKPSERITALYELGKGKVAINRKLSATKMKTNRVIANTKPSGRITALYEFGKSKVSINRKLAATKLKTNRVILNSESNRPSERITGLYELGKSRVTTNRRHAAMKLRTSNDRAKKTAVLSNKKASASETTGQRLHIQAQSRAERHKMRIQNIKATPSPQMKLATQRRSHKKQIKRQTPSMKRLSALYEKGKNRVRANIELELKVKSAENKPESSSNKKTIARYATMRQSQLYELGRQRLVNKKLNEKRNYKEKNYA